MILKKKKCVYHWKIIKGCVLINFLNLIVIVSSLILRGRGFRNVGDDNSGLITLTSVLEKQFTKHIVVYEMSLFGLK